jgi:hypothetical protein
MVDFNIAQPNRQATFAGTSSLASGVGGPATTGVLGFNSLANAQQRQASDDFQEQLLRTQELQRMLGQRALQNERLGTVLPELRQADTPTAGMATQNIAMNALGLQPSELAQTLNPQSAVANLQQQQADVENTRAQATSRMADAGFRGPQDVTTGDLRSGDLSFMFSPPSVGIDTGLSAQQQLQQTQLENAPTLKLKGPQVTGVGQPTIEGALPQSGQMREAMRNFVLGGGGAGQQGGGTGIGTEQQQARVRSLQDQGVTVDASRMRTDEQGNIYVPMEVNGERGVGVYDPYGEFVGTLNTETGEVEPPQQGQQ